MWDYDPESRQIRETGAVVPATCPVETHPQMTLYLTALGLWSLLDKGHLGLADISAAWHSAAVECYALSREAIDG